MCIIVIIVVAINSKMGDIKIVAEEKNETMQKQEEQSTTKALTEIKAREPNTNNFTYVASEDGIKVPVPKGYVASTDLEERYVNGITTTVDDVTTREHHGGFVIYEKNEGETDEQATAVIENDIDEAQRERNQWVLVPISSEEVENMYHMSEGQIYANYYKFSVSGYSLVNTTTIEPALVPNVDTDNLYLKQYLPEITSFELLQEMREEFHEMLESVKTYGGFYIGRYETGNLRKNNAKVIKGQSGIMLNNHIDNNISDINWYTAYKKCMGVRGKNSVSTGLIWGIQWNETLKWLIDSEEKTAYEVGVDSTSWNILKNSSTITVRNFSIN